MLEQVLSTLSVNWAVATPLHAARRWALHFVGRLNLRVEVVVQGRAHVTVAGQSFWAEQGDCYVIAGRRPYRIAADPDTPSVFAAPYYEDEHGTPRAKAEIGEGHDTTLLGAGFTCEPEDARLLRVLPPVIHVRAGAAGATVAAMSRSTFFLRFREATGMSPLDYLYRLRMRHAARLLRDTPDTVASVATAAGYRTESAFSAAFRRFADRSPREYRAGE